MNKAQKTQKIKTRVRTTDDFILIPKSPKDLKMLFGEVRNQMYVVCDENLHTILERKQKIVDVILLPKQILCIHLMKDGKSSWEIFENGSITDVFEETTLPDYIKKIVNVNFVMEP